MYHKQYNIILIFLVIIPLMLGLLLYTIFREDTYISRFVLSVIKFNNLSDIKNQISIQSPIISYLSKNYIPDCCWAFSLEACLALILHDSKRMVVISLIISSLFLSTMETLQLTPLIPGTFDSLDIVIELVAIVISGIIINQLRKRCIYEKNN